MDRAAADARGKPVARSRRERCVPIQLGSEPGPAQRLRRANARRPQSIDQCLSPFTLRQLILAATPVLPPTVGCRTTSCFASINDQIGSSAFGQRAASVLTSFDWSYH